METGLLVASLSRTDTNSAATVIATFHSGLTDAVSAGDAEFQRAGTLGRSADLATVVAAYFAAGTGLLSAGFAFDGETGTAGIDAGDATGRTALLSVVAVSVATGSSRNAGAAVGTIAGTDRRADAALLTAALLPGRTVLVSAGLFADLLRASSPGRDAG